jgi:hypothetical protein
MVSSTSIIQELIPQLSGSLGQLRRVPGKGDVWVTHVITTLEKERDPRFERMRRRIGFAQRLGTLADIPDEDIALATLGLFFHELLPLKPNGVKVARPWRQFLLRNEDWLRPAFEVCETVRYRSWAELEDAAEIVAKVAAVYDSETLDRHQRPMVVAESIMAEAEGRDAQRIVDLLWTEDGQALCDHHFRRHPRGYRLDPKDIRSALAALYNVTPHISSEIAVQSMRSGGTARRGKQETEVEQPLAAPDKENGPLGNFDRRREALRTRTSEADSSTGETPTYDEFEKAERDDVEPSRIEAKLREMESAEQQTELVSEDVEDPHRGQTQTREPEPIGRQREERMNQLATISPASHARGDALDVRDRLQELRIQLGQIQQIAAQAEQLLDGIAPQIDEFAARISDVEAVMDRWSGRSRAAA